MDRDADCSNAFWFDDNVVRYWENIFNFRYFVIRLFDILLERDDWIKRVESQSAVGKIQPWKWHSCTYKFGLGIWLNAGLNWKLKNIC